MNKKSGESARREATELDNLDREEKALKELYADPQYEEQKAFWPEAKAHFNYFDVFERIIDERTARQKAQSLYVA